MEVGQEITKLKWKSMVRNKIKELKHIRVSLVINIRGLPTEEVETLSITNDGLILLSEMMLEKIDAARSMDAMRVVGSKLRELDARLLQENNKAIQMLCSDFDIPDFATSY